ncbi:hypothetical protein GSI_12467 [Ganoderma sinense ZZ0214-1]|uniref:Transporter n=1 Tax=Ganoderma sinense ZZ0214-1 TaxID=1077348 RepID=A0A2G8RSV9_9APHY|nr:hypothetical protein GSI_12467 [Ganoderma sinense ZZ0214-1]
MKFFSQLVSFVPVVVLGAVGTMAQSSDTVITAIEAFTAKSSALCTTVRGLDFSNFVDTGSEIIRGLDDITTAVTRLNSEFSSTTPAYTDPVAAKVVNVLTTFVAVYQELLIFIMSKHSLAAQFFLAGPIRNSLRALEAAVNTFSSDLIPLIPTQSGPAMTQISALKVTFAECLQTYSY